MGQAKENTKAVLGPVDQHTPAAILALFPAGAHPLVLAHDPDGLLADPVFGEALARRGYRLVRDTGNSFALWLAADSLRPWRAEQPLLIVTARPLNTLPFDLWAQAHRVELALGCFFPNLSLPVVRQLSSAQRARLFAAKAPADRLGREGTARFLLHQVFGGDLASLGEPTAFLEWLWHVHSELGPLPEAVRSVLLAELSRSPAYADWPLAEMLMDEAAFRAQLARVWPYTRGPNGAEHGVGEALGHLARETRFSQHLGALYDMLAEANTWSAWSGVAWRWAEALALTLDDAELAAGQAGELATIRDLLDERWLGWLQANYAPLAGVALPDPHHLYHVLTWLASLRHGRRLALVVLDGLALSDWLVLREAWLARHPDWRLSERLAMAQLPTVTSVSRQALVSGRPPRAFAHSIASSAAEAQGWRAFWAGEGLPPEAIAYEHLALGRDVEGELALSHHTVALCLVDDSIDALCHAATLGAAGARDGLHRWVEERSSTLEAVLANLLKAGYVVCLASDHGHVEAFGVGRPADGILAETRGQRARLYGDLRQAQSIAARNADTVVWPSDNILPDGVHAVLHTRRGAFAPAGERLVSHGGATIEEVCVPIVLLERSA